MAKARTAAKTKTTAVAAADSTPKASGAMSGVSATGNAGKDARAAAAVTNTGGSLTGWRDPAAKYADDDMSIDARMWRTYTDGIRK